MLTLHDVPGDHQRQARFAGHATAGTELEQVLFVAPFACTVTAVEYVADSAQTGSDTTYATLTVYNRGAANAGTASVAALAFTAGIDLAANTPSTITVSATAANLSLATGDVITAKKSVTSTGRALPGGIVVVHTKAR